jgi:hypothetical protein
MHSCRGNYLGPLYVRTECRVIRNITYLLCDTFGSNFGSSISCAERKIYEERRKECKKRRMRNTETETDIKDNTAVKEKNAKEGKELKKREETLWH